MVLVNYGAMNSSIKRKTKSNLLSTPSIVTMDNEEAYIVVGENVPFVTGSVIDQVQQALQIHILPSSVKMSV